jgi:hypothetical protein
MGEIMDTLLMYNNHAVMLNSSIFTMFEMLGALIVMFFLAIFIGLMFGGGSDDKTK